MIVELIFFTISVLPVFLIGYFIYKKDKQKEPSKLLVKLFLGGIGSCFLTLIMSLILEIIFPNLISQPDKGNLIQLFFRVFIGVALVEEFCKWIMAYKISYNDKNFDELYDAIIYCIFVSLGFACFENLMYVYENGFVVGIVRAFLAVPGHACDGLFMGYYLGLSKTGQLYNNKNIKNKNLILSILIPTLAHGIYDYCLFTQMPIFIILFFIFIICMYIYALKKIKSVSSINKKIKYKDNYCRACGHIVEGNYCPVCGRKNE